MKFLELIIFFGILWYVDAAEAGEPHLQVQSSDVERWLDEAMSKLPSEALDSLAELKGWKNGETFRKWQSSQSTPVDLYLPTNATSDACYIVRLKEDTPRVLIQFVVDAVQKVQGEIPSYFEKLFKGLVVCFKGSEDAVDTLKGLPFIEYIERDCHIWSGQVQKQAPWGLSRIAQQKQPLSYQFGFDLTGLGIDVYVLDSGIFSDHPEFGGRARLLYNAIDREEYKEKVSSRDCSGHGTEVASIIAGKWLGVAKRANIKAVQVLGCNGNGRNSDLIHALEWVATHRTGPSIIHLSLGGPKSRALDEVVATMTAGHIPVIIAAGNADQDACNYSPGGSRKAITVGATTEHDQRADYSNFGTCINLFAPGDNILVATQPSTDKIAKRPPVSLTKSSTNGKSASGMSSSVGMGDRDSPDGDPTFASSPTNVPEQEMAPIELGYNEGYVISSGTSMAAPFVTGVFAVLMEKYPQKTANQLWDIINALAVKGVLDSETLKNSPNVLLQAPKYDRHSTQNLIPDLNDGNVGLAQDITGSSLLAKVSLNIILFVIFAIAALAMLLICIVIWMVRARRAVRRTQAATGDMGDANFALNTMPNMSEDKKAFLKIEIDPNELQRIKASSPTPTV